MDFLDNLLETCAETSCKNIDLIKCIKCQISICISHKESLQTECNHDTFTTISKQLNDPAQKNDLINFIDTLVSLHKTLYINKSDHFAQVIQDLSRTMSSELSRLSLISTNLLAIRAEIVKNSKCPTFLLESCKQFASYKLNIKRSGGSFPDAAAYLKTCFQVIPENNHYIELTKITQENPDNPVKSCLSYLKSSDFHLYQHMKEPNFVASNENFIVSLSPSERRLKIWEIESLSLKADVEINGEVLTADLDINSNSVILGLSPRAIQVLPLSFPDKAIMIEHPDFNNIRCIKSSKRVKLIGNNLCEILVLDHNYTYKAILTAKNEKSSALSIAINEAANIFAVSPNSNNILIFSMISLTQIRTIRTRGPSKFITFHMNRLVISDEKGKIKLINVETGQLESQISGYESFSSNSLLNKLFLWSSTGKGLHIYTQLNGVEKKILENFPIYAACCDLNEKFLAFIDGNRELFIFSDEVRKFPGHCTEIQKIWFNEAKLVTCAGSEVSVWDLQSKKLLKSQRLDEEVQSIQEAEKKIKVQGVEGTCFEIDEAYLQASN